MIQGFWAFEGEGGLTPALNSMYKTTTKKMVMVRGLVMVC